MKEKMSIKEWAIVLVLTAVILLAVFGMLGVIDTLAAEITPTSPPYGTQVPTMTPTRTMRPTLTATPAEPYPGPVDPYPGPNDASSVGLVSFTASGGKMSAGTWYVVIMTIIIGALVIWLERRLWGKR